MRPTREDVSDNMSDVYRCVAHRVMLVSLISSADAVAETAPRDALRAVGSHNHKLRSQSDPEETPLNKAPLRQNISHHSPTSLNEAKDETN